MLPIIIGAKTKDQLLDNIGSLSLELAREEIIRLDGVSTPEPEYPGWSVARQMQGRIKGKE